MSDVNTQGKKFKSSDRPSVNVRVGDWVKIVFPDGASEWRSEAMKMVGNVYLVKNITAYHTIYVEHKYTFAFSASEIIIMEDITPVKVSRNHPHADMIRQWLDDASLEVETLMAENSGNPWWEIIPNPLWMSGRKYRFKPKTVPAWKVLYEYGGGDIDLTAGHYRNEEEFNKLIVCNEKFIKFVLETEKQIPA